MNPLTEAQATVMMALGYEYLDGPKSWFHTARTLPHMNSRDIDWNFTMGTVVPWALQRIVDMRLSLSRFESVVEIEASFSRGSSARGDDALTALWLALSEAVRSEGEQRCE